MSNRIIRCNVENEFIRGAGVVIGAAGSHDDVELELCFSPVWDGTSKKIVWFDALGEQTVVTVLGAGQQVAGTNNRYRVPVPGEAKAVEGDMKLTIRGATVSGTTETRAVVAATACFKVLPALWDPLAVESSEPSADVSDQLQQEIEDIKDDLALAAAAADAKQAAETSAAAAASSAAKAAGSASLAAEQATGAQFYANSAGVAEDSAKDYMLTASLYADDAQTASTAAASSATAAAGSAANAATSATNAANSAAAAENCVYETQHSAAQAEISKEEAEDAATAAEGQAGEAAASANAAASSAAEAASSAKDAARSDSEAADSAAQAATSAAQAASSATAAAASVADMVPATRTVNGKALSADISLNADDAGAVALEDFIERIKKTGSARIEFVSKVPPVKDTREHVLYLLATDSGLELIAKTIVDRALGNFAQTYGVTFAEGEESKSIFCDIKLTRKTLTITETTTLHDVVEAINQQFSLTDLDVTSVFIDWACGCIRFSDSNGNLMYPMFYMNDADETFLPFKHFNFTNVVVARSNSVPRTRTINGKALDEDISLTASDVGAVPATRTVNGKALSADISLTASDVGAAAAGHGTHVTFSSNGPKMDGTASTGMASSVARSDHVHPTDTSRAAANHTHTAADVGAATMAQVNAAISAAIGSAMEGVY